MPIKKKKRIKVERGRTFGTESSKVSEDDILEELSKLSYDPHDLTAKIVAFGKALTGIPLYKYQEKFAYRIIYSVISFEGATLTGLWSRQSGKSETMAFVIDTLMVIMPLLAKVEAYKEFNSYKNGFKIGLYAPQQLQVDTTYDRAMERLGSENAEMIMSEPDIEIGLVSNRYLELSNGSVTTGQVASKTSKIESKTWDLIIIEECQDMDDFVMQKSIEPMTSATAGTIVKVGTTGTVKNNFYEEIQSNKKEQRKIKDERLMLHFEFDYLAVIKYKAEQFAEDNERFHLFYKKDVLKKRDKWGAESDAFKLGYALIWAMESGMFMTDADFTRCCNRRIGTPDAEELKKKWLVVAGIDFGKDNDSTVVTIGRSFYKDENEYTTTPPMKQIFDWVELRAESYELQHHVILDALVEWGVQIAYCDYTGVGKPPTDRLMAACGDQIMIVPYHFTRATKSDMYTAFHSDIKEGRLIIPANRTTRTRQEFGRFEAQMKGLRKRYEAGFMVCEHGTGIGEHDDYCDSAALFTLAANHDLPEEFEEDENVFYNPDMGMFDHTTAHW